MIEMTLERDGEEVSSLKLTEAQTYMLERDLNDILHQNDDFPGAWSTTNLESVEGLLNLLDKAEVGNPHKA